MKLKILKKCVKKFGVYLLSTESAEHLLELIRTNGEKLLETIESTKPKVDSVIEDAEKHDTKEYVKEKIEEEGQQGLLSKFSAPGKYRRNMKQLKKQRKFLDDIAVEVRSILSVMEEEGNEKSCEVITEDKQPVSSFKFLASQFIALVFNCKLTCSTA